MQRRPRRSASSRRSNPALIVGEVVVVESDDLEQILVAEQIHATEISPDEFEQVLREARQAEACAQNPSRVEWIAGAVGAGLLLGGLAWWLLRNKNPKGYIMCANVPYPGVVRLGDYVVVQLAANDRSFSEPTWAKVRTRLGSQIRVEIVGETAEDGPKPIATERHGFKLGDVVTMPIACVYDRFRPGQAWRVLCGPALADAGFSTLPGNQASALHVDDRAQVVVGGARGGIEALWLDISSVSPGQQTIRGVITTPPLFTDHGLKVGDEIEFLRDCVIDAEFGTGG